jgi:hypothetical protein
METFEAITPMKTRLNDLIKLCYITREEAEQLLKIINKSKTKFSSLKLQIEMELKPIYQYEIKCQDCPRIYTYESLTIIPDAEIKRGGICSICSDDYK